MVVFAWSTPIAISNTGGIVSFAIWYDRWSNIAAGKIHFAWINSADSDVKYRSLDSENSDTLSAVTTIFLGTSQASNGTLSITRARGGNLICGGCIDAGAELFCYKSTDVGANWTSIAAVSEATQDQLILLPGWAADNQDAMCFFWDASADEISRKLYDDSANLWAESSIATSMTDTVAGTSGPHFAATVDITNSQNLLVAWSAVDTGNADLRCWKVTEGAKTEVTNVILNSTDDQGMCSINIDINSNYWYVYYGGKSDGSETWNTAVNIYYKVSQDGGTTWGAETILTSQTYKLLYLYSCIRVYSIFNIVFYCNDLVETSVFPVYIIKNGIMPRTTFQLGM